MIKFIDDDMKLLKTHLAKVFFSERVFVVSRQVKYAMSKYSDYIKLTAESILLHTISVSWPSSIELLT